MNNKRRQLLESLGERLISVMRRVHRSQAVRFSEFKLSSPQIRILFFIARRGKATAVKDLAEMLRVTPGAITQFVDGLVEMGLVRREEDPKDRRIIRIKLTELAKIKLEELRKGYLVSASQVFDVLTDAEVKELLRLLDKVDTHPA